MDTLTTLIETFLCMIELLPKKFVLPMRNMMKMLQDECDELRDSLSGIRYNLGEAQSQLRVAQDELEYAQARVNRLQGEVDRAPRVTEAAKGQMLAMRKALGSTETICTLDAIREYVIGVYDQGGGSFPSSGKIHAIKALRAISGCGLKEGKEQVEFWANNRLHPEHAQLVATYDHPRD